jgi:A/G-specific adenine glycosylase
LDRPAGSGQRLIANKIRHELLTWARRQKRQLPWRGTRDSYRIWISEVMLQQTTVEAVAARYARFLSRFPDLRALARAREESVLAAWSGLGYYARARNLRRAARLVSRDHGGNLPRDPRTLERLPGFGRYTAAAVVCLAHGARVPAIDANVTRVLSRLFAINGIAGRREHRRAVEDRARQLLTSGRPDLLTAAIMDLGQLVCVPRRPLCESCPLEAVCEARRRGNPGSYPRRARRPVSVRVFLATAFARRDGRVLLVRRPPGLLEGLWEFPCAQATTRTRARRALAERIRPLGMRLGGSPIGMASHTVVNRRLLIAVLPATANSNFAIRNSKSSPIRWLTPEQLERAAIPTLTRKIARAAGLLD